MEVYKMSMIKGIGIGILGFSMLIYILMWLLFWGLILAVLIGLIMFLF